MTTQLALAGLDTFIDSATDAIFSPDRKYRYALMRRWAPGNWYESVEGGILNVIGCNPSSADELVNDATSERLERRARRMGFGALVITNIFAWRSRRPRVLRRIPDPIGIDNNKAILDWAKRSKMVICAWGMAGTIRHRAENVNRMLSMSGINTHYLRLCDGGQPQHPLYISYATQPKPYSTGPAS